MHELNARLKPKTQITSIRSFRTSLSSTFRPSTNPIRENDNIPLSFFNYKSQSRVISVVDVILTPEWRFGHGSECCANLYCRFINGLTINAKTSNANLRGIEMCQDMRRFERMAEEKKRNKKEKELNFIVDQVEEKHVTSKTEVNKRS